jgi:hypothetical protein
MGDYLTTRKSPIIIPNPDFENVGAGKRCIARIPVGATYLESFLVATVGGAAASAAQLKSDIEYVRLTANAKEKWNITGAQLYAYDEFFRSGVIGATGIMPLFHRRPWMQTIANQIGPRYGTADLTSLTLEVKLSSGAAIDGLSLFHRQEGATPLGTHNTLLTENRPYAAIGTQQIFDLPRDPSTRLFGLHLQTDETHVTRIQLKADNFTELDVTVGELKRVYALETSPRTWQTGFVHLDFSVRGLFDDTIPMTMDKLELAVTYDAAPGNVPIVMDIARPSDTPAAKAA